MFGWVGHFVLAGDGKGSGLMENDLMDERMKDKTSMTMDHLLYALISV